MHNLLLKVCVVNDPQPLPHQILAFYKQAKKISWSTCNPSWDRVAQEGSAGTALKICGKGGRICGLQLCLGIWTAFGVAQWCKQPTNLSISKKGRVIAILCLLTSCGGHLELECFQNYYVLLLLFRSLWDIFANRQQTMNKIQNITSV